MITASGNRLLPAVSAVLLFSAFPPLHLLIPSFVALVPVAVWTVDRGAERSDAGEAFAGGLWFGLLYFGLLLHWIAAALVSFTAWAIPVYLAVVAALSLGAGSFAWALHRMVRRGRMPLWLALPSTWTCLEWLRAHAPGELAFPWMGLGTSLTAFPELVGIAELIGARGVTFWLALLNGLLAEVVLAARPERGRRRALAFAAAFVVVLAIPAGWGYWRAYTLPLRVVGRVVAVQPNISGPVRLDQAASIDSTLTALELLAPTPGAPSEAGRARSFELVVWPEGAILAPIEQDDELRRRVLNVAARWGAPVLFGAIGQGDEATQGLMPFNSAFLTTADGSLTPFRYDKHRLVPLVERVPFVPISWVEREEEFRQYGRGDDWPLGSMAGGSRFGTLVCYESAYPGHSRRFRQEGADVLVNLTNDAWFGGDPWYARTTALWQHPAHLVMRAIENRVGIARAANTGVSLFVDPRGRVEERTEFFTRDVTEATLLTSDVMTLYTRTGDVAGLGAVLVTLMSVAGVARRRLA